MALVTVLMVSVVLLGMAGAFFHAHKADLALLTSTSAREDTKNACLSAAEFIQFKLTNNRNFGATPFGGKSAEVFPAGSANPVLRVEYRGNGVDANDNVVMGTFTDSGLTFEASILNNLNNRSAGVADEGKTPPRTVRVWITATRGNVVKKLDFILKRSPFSKSSILSGGDVDVGLSSSSDDGAWWMGSRQPSGNAVRAKGQISGPEVLSASGRKVIFEPPDGLAGKVDPPYGVLQADRLRMSLNGVPTDLTTGNPHIEEAENNIKGALSAGGKVNVPELDGDKLPRRTMTADIPAKDVVFRSVETAGVNTQQLLQDGNVVAQYDGANPTSRFHSWTNSAGQTVAVFDLEGRTMTVEGNTELVSKDTFSLSSQMPNGDEDITNQPTLVLGSADMGSTLSAEGIDINGSVGGRGALKSGTSGLAIRAKSSLSTTPDHGIAIHSEGDVVLSKPAGSSKDGIPVDWDVFKNAMEEVASSGSSAFLDQLDGWSDLDDSAKQNVAERFQRSMLAESGEMDSFDPLWQGLTTDFPSDTRARALLEEWLKPGVPAVMGPDPDWVAPPPPEPPMIDVGGEMVPDPDWEAPPPPEAPEIVLEPAIPAGPGVSVEKYVRLREYLRTVKAGDPNDSWLTNAGGGMGAQRSEDVTELIKGQLGGYQNLAGQYSVEANGVVELRWNSLSKYFRGRNPFLASYKADMTFRGLVYSGRDFIFDADHKGVELEGALVTQGSVKLRNATGARFIYNSDLLENIFVTETDDSSSKFDRAYWSFY